MNTEGGRFGESREDIPAAGKTGHNVFFRPERNPMIYFAYDITMDEREMKREDNAPGAILAGNGWLANRRLVFYGGNGTIPVASPRYGERVYGVLYFVSDPVEIERVKRLRLPLPRRVTRVRTLPHNRIVFAFTFEAAPGIELIEGPVTPEYRAVLLEIARARGFPPEYIEHVESIPLLEHIPNPHITHGE